MGLAIWLLSPSIVAEGLPFFPVAELQGSYQSLRDEPVLPFPSLQLFCSFVAGLYYVPYRKSQLEWVRGRSCSSPCADDHLDKRPMHLFGSTSAPDLRRVAFTREIGLIFCKPVKTQVYDPIFFALGIYRDASFYMWKLIQHLARVLQDKLIIRLKWLPSE